MGYEDAEDRPRAGVGSYPDHGGRGAERVSPRVGAIVKGGLKAMFIAKLKLAAALTLAAGVAGLGGGAAAYPALRAEPERAAMMAVPAVSEEPAPDDDLPPPIPSEKFAAYFKMVKPYPGEYRWRDEIPWVGTIHEARERAAREDKPILVWQSANSPCLGST